ncbi:isocitrate lyase/phosphoenolpyruvate mutase family protein [Aliiroseovarius subalbicans]|uniref:isocitrate lyase/PEP mutase family protein n=1 Tax=Aliiroseovarius subalbicans TaxID=2925840 RepID=UPI001F5A8842|nr:isocitrate lyase/phosphoenolpyruvate mutase family protein [Aliiroseovarius subalbicans]MCI2398238.1 isocitrate lyase/phosphoenolpyruvate mutase family protein [Aliiroseovarius subalbicans]
MTRDIGADFRALHVKGDPFILANAWDIGSAKLLAGLGAQAIATSSGAHAFTLGRPDMGTISRDEALSHAQDLVAAVNLPVSGDFENGFGDSPEACAETVRLAAEVGLAGISIEDTALPGTTVYPRDLAIERIRAAAAAARALPRDFVLVARADGIMNGQHGLDEALARVQGFEGAGADCLYVPMPGGMGAQAQICAATTLPVNALAAGPFAEVSRSAFATAGVARISLGSALARATHRLIQDLGHAMFDRGDFSALSHTISGGEVADLMAKAR